MRVGIVGVGSWGQRVADKLAKLTIDGKPVTIVAHCRKGNVPIERYGRLVSLPELIHSPDVDVVVAMAPPVTTLLAASEAMKIGKPILVTKPFLMTENIIPKSPIFIDLVRLWSPCWSNLKYGVFDKIGLGLKITNVDVRFGGQNQTVGPVRSFAPIFDYGPHIFAFLHDLFGESASFSPQKVQVDDVMNGRKVYTFAGTMGGADLAVVTGNGLDGGLKHFRVTMNDGSFFCYMEDKKVCAFIGPGTLRTKQVHVEWNHEPLTLMLMNFLLDCRLRVVDPRTFSYSRLGILACNIIEAVSVSG